MLEKVNKYVKVFNVTFFYWTEEMSLETSGRCMRTSLTILTGLNNWWIKFPSYTSTLTLPTFCIWYLDESSELWSFYTRNSRQVCFPLINRRMLSMTTTQKLFFCHLGLLWGLWLSNFHCRAPILWHHGKEGLSRILSWPYTNLCCVTSRISFY